MAYKDWLTREEFQDATLLAGEVARDFMNKWHWLGHHAQFMTPFMISLSHSAKKLDRIESGLAATTLRDISKIGGREKDLNDYDQIIQYLSEILVMSAVVDAKWPDTASFAREEKSPASTKRVDLVVRSEGLAIGIEIKCPKLLDHQRERSTNQTQLVGRLFPPDKADLLSFGGKPTLPRDNPVADFLSSANDKFVGFRDREDFIGILVIVWDDFVYEPITALLHEESGLLTEKSFKKKDGLPVTYGNIDAVVIIRHTTYIKEAAAGNALQDGRRHPFHIGGEGAMPNVYIQMPGGRDIPEPIKEALWLFPIDDPRVQMAAEYRAQDFIWWQTIPTYEEAMAADSTDSGWQAVTGEKQDIDIAKRLKRQMTRQRRAQARKTKKKK